MSRPIARSAALPVGGALCFEALVAGRRRSCVALRSASGLSAFVNVCAHRHQPVVVDDRPFDEAGRLECRAHGAFYDASTGLCVEGPCEGARLVAVPVRDEGGELVVLDDDVVDDSVYAADDDGQ